MPHNIDYSQFVQPAIDVDFATIQKLASEVDRQNISSPLIHNFTLYEIPFGLKTQDQKNFFHLLFQQSDHNASNENQQHQQLRSIDSDRRTILSFYLSCYQRQFKQKQSFIKLFKERDSEGKTPIDYLFENNNEDTIVTLFDYVCINSTKYLEEMFSDNVNILKGLSDKESKRTLSQFQKYIIEKYDSELKNYKSMQDSCRSGGEIDRLSISAFSALSGDNSQNNDVASECCLFRGVKQLLGLSPKSDRSIP